MVQRALRSAVTHTATNDTVSAAAHSLEQTQRGPVESAVLHCQGVLGNQATRNFLSAYGVQPKLRIGSIGDRYELEADRMADQVMGMAAPVVEPGSTISAVSSECGVQRACPECEEALRDQPEDDDEALLQREVTAPQPPPADGGLESRINGLGTGLPLPPLVRDFFEPRFNHDFSNVRVHTGNTAGQAALAAHARAFTLGHNVVFGAGEYRPESGHGQHLLAHELTHVVQQTPLVARRTPLPQRQIATPADSSIDTTAEPQPVTVPGLIVDNASEDLSPGQMRKNEFITELRSGICAAADEALAGTEYTAQGCPTIQLYLRFYERQSAQRIERDLLRFMPEAAGIEAAGDYVPLIAARVQRSVARWVQSGEIIGVPEGVPDDLPGAEQVQRVLFKARAGGVKGNPSPHAVQAQLGTGRPLPTSVQSRMGRAFGQGFSQVRLHTDATAGRLSNRHNARAFTVGRHVAFGAGEYQPGTLMGDALIAHELAHVVQQGGRHDSVAPMQAGTTANNAMERDADHSAVGALASMWQGARGLVAGIAHNALPRLRSGLSLQRCSSRDCSPGHHWELISATCIATVLGVGRSSCEWRCVTTRPSGPSVSGRPSGPSLIPEPSQTTGGNCVATGLCECNPPTDDQGNPHTSGQSLPCQVMGGPQGGGRGARPGVRARPPAGGRGRPAVPPRRPGRPPPVRRGGARGARRRGARSGGSGSSPPPPRSGLSVVPRRGMASRTVRDAQGRQVTIYGQSGSASTTPGHNRAIENQANRMAQSGTYEYVLMQRSWRTATGRVSPSRAIPDVIGVRRDGRVDAFEVMSRTDTAADLNARLQSGMSSLPAARRGSFSVIDPEP